MNIKKKGTQKSFNSSEQISISENMTQMKRKLKQKTFTFGTIIDEQHH